MVDEKIDLPVRGPTPGGFRAGIMGFAGARRNAFFLAIKVPFFPPLRGRADRSTVTGKSQMVWVNQSFLNRTLQELLLIETENKGKRIFLFEFPMFQQRKEFGCGTGRITGSFFTFLFPFGWFHFRETVFRGKIVGVVLPDAGKEIIKSPDAGSIPERETAKDGIKGSFPEHAAPDRDGSYFQLQSKQIGTQHAGREPGFRAKNRVTLLHNGIRQGKIQIPELHDIIPGTFRKHERIRIKLKKIGYKSILIGGMAARISR